MAETHHLLEVAQKKVSDLESDLSSSETRYKELQTSSSSDIELKKQYTKLQEASKNDKEKLAAFEHEGQILAKKQSDMEREVRKTKATVKEKETEIAKLKDSREQLMKAIEEMQELVRKNESEASNATKSLNAMQAVSHASTDKLAKLEGELAAKLGEIASQRTALETAWSDNGELKRALAELKADRDDLRKQLGEGNSKVIETESSRRDVEQREAVLRATNKQLQDSLQRQMQEANTREERLQNETTEMRKRWHEAITSRDNLAAELGSATTPLLRQISTLQESLRAKGENWQSIEISLSERALRAESSAEIAEHKKLLAEDQVAGLKHQISTLQLKLTDAEAIIQANEGLPERLKKIELMAAEKANEFESKLSLELAQKQSIQATLREMELRYKYDQQENKDNFDRTQKQHELRVSQLNSEIENLREKLTVVERQSNSSSNTNDLSITQNDPFVNKLSRMPGMSLPNGDASYAANDRLQQLIQQREEESRAASLQIKQLQASRDALLDEVSYLSSRNAQLEEESASVPQLTEDANTHRKKLELLLTLLGEKEEELDAAYEDLKEVKSMYRNHMEDLLNQIAPVQ